ncbi:MAG: PilZ domain-containing protein [Pseudoflavonifractor sp.]
MGKLDLKTGAKVDVAAIINGDEMQLKSSFVKGGNQWQLTMPMAGGKSYTPETGTAIVIIWQDEGTEFRATGKVAGCLKQGVRTYLMVAVEEEIRQENRRSSERVRVDLPVELSLYSTDYDGTRSRRDYNAVTSDISIGGLSLFTAASLAVGEMVDLTIARPGTKKLPLRAEICWVRPAPKAAGYRNLAGLKFLFSGEADGAAVAKLTAALAAKQ